MPFKIGDKFMIDATGEFALGIECIVTEVGDDGRIVKAKAAVPDPRLATKGFLIEGEDYIIVEWNWSPN